MRDFTDAEATKFLCDTAVLAERAQRIADLLLQAYKAAVAAERIALAPVPLADYGGDPADTFRDTYTYEIAAAIGRLSSELGHVNEDQLLRASQAARGLYDAFCDPIRQAVRDAEPTSGLCDLCGHPWDVHSSGGICSHVPACHCSQIPPPELFHNGAARDA